MCKHLVRPLPVCVKNDEHKAAVVRLEVIVGAMLASILTAWTGALLWSFNAPQEDLSTALLH
jgi:hypothetical protein